MLSMVLLVISFLIYTNVQYERQFQEGEVILNILTIYSEYGELADGETEGNVSTFFNSTDVAKGLDLSVNYVAKSYDNSNSMVLNDNSYVYPSIEIPFYLPVEIIDTSKFYFELGNGAKVCVEAKFTYKNVNWFGFWRGYPEKNIETCNIFHTQFDS